MFLIGGCQTSEIIDKNETETGQLQFSPTLGGAETATRAAESDNGVLQTASAASAAPHIVIETYTGMPGTSLQKYFSDELGYFESGSYWDVTSENKRFLPTGGMNLYAYFATDTSKKGDLANVRYIPPTTQAAHPTLTFTVPTDDAFKQVDLVAAKVERITSPNVSIPLRHILSQINFGVKGMDQHQITVTNICINEVRGAGSFDYNTWQWTPDTKVPPHTYPYFFPDHKEGDEKSGLGNDYTTQGTDDDSQNSYLFGDGGKFGPGKEDTFLYAQVDPDPSLSNYATAKTATPLYNSLMLLPQEIKKNEAATVTFDYEVKFGGVSIRSAQDNVVRLDAYYNWEPNMRYVYLFKFDDPEKVTFDVLVEQWKNYDGDEGLVGTDELTSAKLFQKYVQPIQPGGTYSVPIGPLTANFLCDWSLFTLDNSFTAAQSFTLKFESELPFKYGKSVIINPPFGFTASVTSLKAPGTVTFTAGPHSYYSTSEAVQSAIDGGGGNHEFNVRDAVKLNEITFTGSKDAECSLVLHYPTPYIGALPNRWQLSGETAFCFPNDYAQTSSTAPYSYTIYTVQGLQAVFDWMNNDGTPPGGGTSTTDVAVRMQTNINLIANANYNLAEVYKSANNALETEFSPIGSSSPYTGIFDGKGATVSNLYINVGYTTKTPGFFNNVGGTVQYLHLTNASVTSTGDWTVGGLIGVNNGIVQGCSVQGTIQGTGGVTGGIAGQNNAFIYACSSTATVNGSSSTVGGITGYNGGQVWSCYATNGENVVGANGNTVKTSYYVSTSEIGAVVGSTRLPSIAVLNGRIAQLNETIIYVPAHFVSGNLNATPPSIAAGAPAGRGTGGVLKGTFIQNWFALYWNQDRWNEEMALLATLGMEYLVIDQVMEYNKGEQEQYMSWYQASQNVLVNDPTFFINANPSALEYCMNACRAHDIKLFIGTFFDKRYWDSGAAVTNSEKWNNCIITANKVMDDLISKYFHDGTGNYKDVLAGWYFPYEVDDLFFQTVAAKDILKAGIKKAMLHRNTLANADVKKPYLFSPFMNGASSTTTGTMNAEEYAALWRGIISETGFTAGDILSPQDCIGVGKLTLPELATWMHALKGATSAVTDVQFWINVETFGPGGDASFLTKEQIPASKKHTDTLISFSYPIYYSPNSNFKIGDHKAYKAYYDAQ